MINAYSTKMFIRLLILLTLFGATACMDGEYETTITGETEIAQLAINAWIDRGNAFPQSCYREMGNVQIYFSTPDQWDCPSNPDTTDGCHERKGSAKQGTSHSRILLGTALSPLQANVTLAHEYMHLLSHCAYGSQDKGHSRDSVWGEALGDIRTYLIHDDLRFRRGETDKRIEL